MKLWKNGRKKLCAIVLSIAMILSGHTVKPMAAADNHLLKGVDLSMVPSDALEQDGHYYKVIDQGMSWYEAEIYCEEMNGHLATITSGIEQTTIERLLEKGTKHCYWIGGVYNVGEWQWITGEEFLYHNWAFAQPDYNTSSSENGEDALMIYKDENPRSDSSFGQWNDVYNDGTCGDEDFFGKSNFGLVCEWDSFDLAEKKLQCDSSCSIMVGHTEKLKIAAFEYSKEELDALTKNVEWKSENPDIATIIDDKFIPPITYDYTHKYEGYNIWHAYGLLQIKGESEGTTVITGTSPGGLEITCRVTVEAGEETSAGNSAWPLGLGDDIPAFLPDNIAKFFPAEWSMNHAVFPMNIEEEEGEEDGISTIRATIGVAELDKKNHKIDWTDYKSKIKAAANDTRNNYMTVERLRKLSEQYDGKTQKFLDIEKCNVCPELSVMGYLEAECDKKKNLLYEPQGGVAVAAEWAPQMNWQFFTPVGPLYTSLIGSIEASGNLGIKLEGYGKETRKLESDKLKLDGELDIEPSFSIEGGYGINKVATIGAGGKISVPITVLPLSSAKGEVSANAFIHVTLIFFIESEFDLPLFEMTLWDNSEPNKKVDAGKGNALQFSKGKFSEIDTSFAEAASEWNGGKQKRRKASEKETSLSDSNAVMTLQEGILPSSLPMQIQVGDKKVMVFQAYDNTRTTLNSSVLKYSVCENGIWSEPKAVSDDGFADMYADMKLVDGKLVLAWQKAKKTITGNVEADSEQVFKDIAKNSEIVFSIFNEKTNTFEKPICVTDNDEYDMMPYICGTGSDIIVSWIRNDAAEIMQQTGYNTIYTAKWNGSSFEEEKVLSQAPGTIDNYVVYQDAKGLQAVFTGQANNITAVFGTDGHIMDALSDLMDLSENGTVTGLNYANGKVNCISKGTLYSYDTFNRTVTSSMAGESAFGAEVKYCTNGEKRGYLWSAYDEETKTGSIMASMAVENGYSDPVVLCEQKGTIWRYLSPVLDSNGDWQIIANALNTETGIHSMAFVTKKSENKLKLEDVSINENDRKNGLTGVDYFVVNTQDNTIHNVEIELVLEDGTTIAKEVPVNILPGAGEYGTTYVDLNSVDATQDITISVYAENQTDKSDCTVKSQAGLSDIVVSADSSETEDTVTITATLINQSSVDAKVLLHLYEDEKKTKELESSKEISLGGKGSFEVQFVLDKKKISYNENNAAYLMLEAEAADGDYNQDNNRTYVVLYQSPEKNTPKSNLIGQEFFVKKMKYKVTKVNADGTGEVKLIGTKKKKSDKKFTTLKIGDTVTYKKQSFKITAVGKNAFNGYKKLKSVTVGKNIKTIGEKAFYQCKKLKKITIKTVKLKSLGKKAIRGINKKAVIKIPKSKFKAYKKLFKKKTGYKKSMKLKK